MAEDRYLIADGNGDYPPLLLIFNQRLSDNALVNCRKGLTQAMESKNRVLLFENGNNVKIFQLIGGRWMSLDSAIELEGAPMPEVKKINFREFL